MKTLLTILGPNGVGKSTTAEEIINKYANTAYVDSDWCRVMNPFIITEESKKNDITEYLLPVKKLSFM